ncbi:hypothetical protein Tco_1495000, partial [Tanacetum coccineum]
VQKGSGGKEHDVTMNVKARRVGDASSTAPSAKTKVNFRSLESDVGSVEADLITPMASVQEVSDSFAILYTDTLLFASTQRFEDVMANGPYMIRNVSIILKKWSLNVSLAKEDLTKPKVGKQKDVEDDGFQGMKGKASKGGKWKIQGNRFNKSINGSYKAVVKPKSSISVSNPFSTLEEDNDNLIDDMVDDTRKNVTHYFVWDDTEFDDMGLLVEEVEHGNASSENE